MPSNAWKNEKRAARDASFQKEYKAREHEAGRKDALDMWSRIEESDASDTVKDILHRMASHVGLE